LATAVTSELIPSVLQEYGERTRRAIADYLPSDRPQQRHLYDLLADYPQRGGKMMRPSICLANARIFGAGVDEALHTAVSIELLHNACLIHDDIEDDSEERRGRPTLHMLHGIPLAINAGDSLSLLSLQPLLRNRSSIGSRLALRILEETEKMACESSEGQAMELGWRWENSVDLTDGDYLTMVLKKTCWLSTIYPSRVGALIGSRDSIDLEPFIRFGFFLGIAFQIQDDLLNLIADERYGQEINGDLWEGKRTLMLIRALNVATPAERERLVRVLRTTRQQKREGQVAWMRRLMDKYDCIDYARQYAHGLAGAAAHEYSLIYGHLPDSRDKRFIEGLVTWVFERT